MSGRLFRVILVETDDKGDQQKTKILGPMGETLKEVHRLQPFGFHSNVPKNSHGLGVQFGGIDGGRTLNMVLGLEHAEHRPKDREVGSSIIYDANGSAVSLVKSEMRIVHAKKTTHVVGNVTLTHTPDGIAIQGGKVTHNGKNIGSDHHHGGVTSGGGTTGDPEA